MWDFIGKNLLLLLNLVKFVTLLLVVFYVLFHTRLFYKLEKEIDEEAKKKHILRTLLIILLFGAAAIYASYSGTDIGDKIIANTRDLAPIAAGMLGGPIAGICAGLMGGIHRMLMGGTSSLPCGIATMLAGVLGALIYIFNKKKILNPLIAIIIVALFESFHMLLVLFFSSLPYSQMMANVQKLAMPMIVSNALGLAFFSFMIRNYRKQLAYKSLENKIENEVEVVNSIQMKILPNISKEINKENAGFKTFEKLIPYMHLEKHIEGYTLFKKDDRADKLYYIKNGSLKLVEINKIVEDREIIGEIGIFSPFHKRTSSAVCITDVEIWSIDQKKLVELSYEIPSLLFELIQLSIKRFTINLKESISDKQKLESELKIARSIQTSMLPRNFPKRDDFAIFANMNPAKEVGGDFYDFYMIDDDKLCITIADVSGKGIAASLFMVRSKVLLKSEIINGGNVGEALGRVNNILNLDNDECMFVTVFCAILNIKTGILCYANAGHNPPLINNGSNIEFMNVNKACVLAGIPNIKYKTEEITLNNGDSIFLYTDGVTEAMNIENKLFSNQRLLESMTNLNNKEVKEIITLVKKKIEDFVGNAPQSDDITMLALKYYG